MKIKMAKISSKKEFSMKIYGHINFRDFPRFLSDFVGLIWIFSFLKIKLLILLVVRHGTPKHVV